MKLRIAILKFLLPRKRFLRWKEKRLQVLQESFSKTWEAIDACDRSLEQLKKLTEKHVCKAPIQELLSCLQETKEIKKQKLLLQDRIQLEIIHLSKQ